MSANLEHLTSWDADWSELSVLVTGIGVTGFSVADTLAELGASVIVIDGQDNEHNRKAAETLSIVGVKEVLLGEDAVSGLPDAASIGGGSASWPTTDSFERGERSRVRKTGLALCRARRPSGQNAVPGEGRIPSLTEPSV